METVNKKVYFGILLLVIFVLTSCNKKIIKENSNDVNVDSVRYDTIIISNCIVPEGLYLELDSIILSDPFIDKKGNYSFYRLLFSSSEETQSFHIEKIISVDEANIRLEKRFTIDELMGGTGNNIKFCKWKTPEIVEITVNGNNQLLNITEMKFVN